MAQDDADSTHHDQDIVPPLQSRPAHGRPAILEHQESSLVSGGGRNRRPIGSALNPLPLVSKRQPTLPTAPPRSQAEGVTSATLWHSSDHQPHQSRREREDESSVPVEQAPSLPRSPSPPSHAQGGAGAALVRAFKLVPVRLADLHIHRPDSSVLPTVHFPRQGSGQESEFLQEAPIWSRMPWKWLYLAYFGLSVGLVFLPYYAVASIFPQWRARPTWTWKRSTLVRLYRRGTRLTFRTHTSLSRDTSKPVPHSETLRCKFVWIDATPDEDIRGELRRSMDLQQISSTRTCGFWYGEPLKAHAATTSGVVQTNHSGKGRDDDNNAASNNIPSALLSASGVGRRAGPDEKVVYHLHGGAYWIGTAHEDDVTAAVNTEVLRYLSQRYRSGRSQASPNNRCSRSLSLDYRLSVPGRPDIGSYPAALLDAVAGYLYLVRSCGFKENNIIVAGDSAGGNLGLALCRYLRDEQVAGVPGSLLLLSPWGDISRSHAGPLSSPNLFATTHTNRDADIISSSVAFRNTAVSAFIGRLPASEAYRNPYLSSCSLQLSSTNGGDGPDWGFERSPKRIYIVSGSAEISHDQHLTLAHRLAAGSRRRVPIYTGDQLSVEADVYEMAARLMYPRPDTYHIALWPSATATPARLTTAAPVSHSSAAPLREEVDPVERQQQSLLPLRKSVEEHASLTESAGSQISLVDLPRKTGSTSDHRSGDNHHDGVAGGSPVSRPIHTSTSDSSIKARSLRGEYLPENGRHIMQSTSKMPDRQLSVVPLSSGAAFARLRSRSQMKTSSACSCAAPITPLIGTPFEQGFYFAGEMPPSNVQSTDDDGVGQQMYQPSGTTAKQLKENNTSAEEGEEYFGMGGEDRTVHLDEVKDAVHDFLLFPWHEPERGQCWERIAQWIDEA